MMKKSSHDLVFGMQSMTMFAQLYINPRSHDHLLPNTSPSIDFSLTRYQPTQSMAASTPRVPTVIGLYGLPGAGKTTLLKSLEKVIDPTAFTCYEGSEVLTSQVPGGLNAFKELPDSEKQRYRMQAITDVREQCNRNEKDAIITGHFSFPSPGHDDAESAFTDADACTYTHIVYLSADATRIARQRKADTMRKRSLITEQALEDWQRFEISKLIELCLKHDIAFTTLKDLQNQSNMELLPSTIAKPLQRYMLEKKNLNDVVQQVTDIAAANPQRQTYLVFDADRTLDTCDTTALFAKKTDPKLAQELKNIFDTHGYTFNGFAQAMLVYTKIASSLKPEKYFDEVCAEVADEVEIHPKIVTLLDTVARCDHIGVMVITCGLQAIWKHALCQAGFDSIDVIGGGHLSGGYLITPEVKGAVVDALRNDENAYVFAFGDSPIDLDMLEKADKAIVVTGEKHMRSKTMDDKLQVALQGGLEARQVLLPPHSSPRLNLQSLPVTHFSDPDLLASILRRRGVRLYTPQDHVQRMLATPMRDANVFGPMLRDAHRRVGWYLATQFLPDFIGTEIFSMPHVQGNTTEGYRLLDESSTLIVAIMRGGEPMANGVNDAFPLAMLLHAKSTGDIKLEHLTDKKTVVLVDSVVNSGKSIADFVQVVRGLNSKIRIAVVAGVVQADAVACGMLKDVAREEEIDLVALRISENKFVGSKTTDTGNRLFNSTHLE